ncbi:DUF2267 domain-containing protein [Micromonospora sp. NPDC005194]|uniref:DUF2267 domain-containing protein n=1 Tax=Micromonospora sp. NPDC005194 TaxID=3156870 RepID=UPI0033A03591
MNYAEFLEAVGKRARMPAANVVGATLTTVAEGVSGGRDERTAEGARAVLTTLREAVSAKDLENLESELPKDFRLLRAVGRSVGA